jgi:hypothetical protein
MARIIGGIVLGILSAIVTIVLIEFVRQAIFPPPAGINMNSQAQMSAYIAALPAGAQAMVALAWFAGAADGGLVAALVSRRHWTIWLVACLVVAVAALNLFTFTHPPLLQLAALVAPLLGGLVASLCVRRMQAGDAQPAA